MGSWGERRAVMLAAAALGVLTLAGCSGDSLPVASSPPASEPSDTTGPSGTPSAPPATFTVTEHEVLATGLRVPWGLAFLPNGSALVGERDGTVRLVGADGTKKVGAVPGVRPVGEGGLLGLAVDAPAGGDVTVFAYLTSTAGDNRVVRMRWAGGRLGPPAVIYSGIAAAANHDGGALVIGPDGNLYVGVGDANGSARAQDRNSPNGKILRLTTTGKIPADNPFPGSPVWSFGHRNVQGLAFDSRGQLWASEFGQNTWDELNRIVKGHNYGWPVVEGRAGKPGYTDPVAQWRTAVASPSGLAIVDDVAFLGALRGERLWQVPLTRTAASDPVAAVKGDYGRIRTVVRAPDGQSLWITTSNRDGRGSPTADDDRVVALALS